MKMKLGRRRERKKTPRRQRKKEETDNPRILRQKCRKQKIYQEKKKKV